MDTMQGIESLMQLSKVYESFSPAKEFHKDEESKLLYQNGTIQTLYDT
jgi:hypothetical protein